MSAAITRMGNKNARIVTGIMDGNTVTVLVSYTTPVVAVINGRVLVSKEYAHFSVTTTKHISIFTRDFSIPSESVDHSEVSDILYALLGRYSLDWL